MSLSQFFMGEKGLYGRLDQITDRTDALVKAFEMEKATLQFYGALQDVMGENDTLKTIVRMEKEHLTKLLRCLIGVALFSAAYMAEVVRGGLQAIPKGQYEGAQALCQGSAPPVIC